MKKTLILLTIILAFMGTLFGVWYFNASHSCSAFFAKCKENTLEHKEKIYLDVREEEEWIAGHVKGALHIKMEDILRGTMRIFHKLHQFTYTAVLGAVQAK